MKSHIPGLSDLQKQLEVIFTCVPGAHEIRIIGRHYSTSLDGQRLERVLVGSNGQVQAYTIGLAKSPEFAMELIERHFPDREAHNCYLAINRVGDRFKVNLRNCAIGEREYPIGFSCTKAKDIQGICAFIVDLDRESTSTDSNGIKLAASPGELEKLDEVRLEIAEELRGYDLHANYQIMSGNGYQMAYFFPTRTDLDETRKTIENILSGLREKYKERASVDTSMSDPARVVRLVGIWNQKPDRAEDMASERVHRVAKLLEISPKSNPYESIQRLQQGMLTSREKARRKKKDAKEREISPKTDETSPIVQQEVCTQEDETWIDQRLGKIALLEVLQKFYSVKVAGQGQGKIQLSCPYHEDKSPSAWISTNANGVQILHCSSPDCPVHDNPKTAIHVMMDNGHDFLSACIELFHEMPPRQQKTCYKCGERICFNGKIRLNLDGTHHKCKRRPLEKQLEDIAKESGERPVIQIIGGQLPEMVNHAEESILKGQGILYQRSGLVVRVLCNTQPPKGINRPQEALVIQNVEIPYLMELFTQNATWIKHNKREDSWSVVDCPRIVAETYLARGTWKVPVLTGVIGAPTLRSDGSILERPGYDEDTGLLFHPGSTDFSPVPANPDRKDAATAIEAFRDLLKGFPFVEEIDFSVAMSAILTTLVRRSIRTAPLHGISAPKMGSGKSLLADVVAMIATGHPCAAMSQADSADEEKKRLLAVLMEGDVVVCIDNIERPLGSDALCSILTQETWKERLLGRNRTMAVSTSVTFFATGNNLTFQGDLSTRALLCMLDPQCERPEERNFDTNLYKLVPKCRGELVKSALTILRAYHVAGRPRQGIQTYGRFEEWSDFVRSALVWLGLPDPGESRKRIEDADPVRNLLRTLLQNWYDCVKDAVTLKELVEISKQPGNVALHEALLEFAGEKGEINQRKLGNALKKFQGRIEDGFRLKQWGKAREGFLLWRVYSV